MKRDPAVLFYTSDFLSSTFHFTNEEVGVLIRLLCMQHIHSRINEEDLGTDSRRVLSLFTKDEGGYYNKDFEEIILQRKRYSESRRENKTKSHAKNVNDTFANAFENQEDSYCDNEICKETEDFSQSGEEKCHNVAEKPDVAAQGDEFCECENEANKQEAQTKQKSNHKAKRATLASNFNRFWDAYPRKVAKVQAEKTFYRLNPDEELLRKILAALEEQKGWDAWQRDEGKFIPHPATWLNQERWMDEMPNKCVAAPPPTEAMGIWL